MFRRGGTINGTLPTTPHPRGRIGECRVRNRCTWLRHVGVLGRNLKFSLSPWFEGHEFSVCEGSGMGLGTLDHP
jgi:hypothetical protein